MSRGAGLDPVDARWPPSAVLLGSQIVVVGGLVVVVVVGLAGGLVVVVVGGLVVVGSLVVVVDSVVLVGPAVVGGSVVGSTVVGSTVVGGSVVGGSVVGSTVVGGSVVGSQIVVVVTSSVSSVSSSVSSVVLGSPIMVVAGRRLLVGWAVWRRTGAVRTPVRGRTLAHSLVRCRSLPPAPSFQILANFAHDLARCRSLALLPFLQALVGRWSLADSPFFQALAVECAWPLPLGPGLAAVTLACPASAGAAMSPATSRAPEATASEGARRWGNLMLWYSFGLLDAAGDTAHDRRTKRVCADLLSVHWGNSHRSSTFGASWQPRLNRSISPGRSGDGGAVDFAE
jgi:hypothetical protein